MIRTNNQFQPMHRRFRAIHGTIYVCQHCSSIFSQKSEMDKHILLNHDVNRVYTCEICKLNHDTLQAARNHMDIHITVNSHVCNLCGEFFKNQTLVNNHILNIHGSAGGVGLVRELSANIIQDNQIDDTVIDLKANSRSDKQVKTENIENKRFQDTVAMVNYPEKVEHSFSTVVNGKHKTNILHKKNEALKNSDTEVNKVKIVSVEDNPKSVGVIVLRNDGTVEIDTIGQTITNKTNDIFHFKQDISENNGFNVQENDGSNNMKFDTNVNFENIESSNEEFRDSNGADTEPELQHVNKSVEMYSEMAETIHSDASKDGVVILNDVSVQTMKPKVIVKDPVEVRKSKLTCEICGRTLSCRSAFKAHLKIHDDIKPYKCLTCGRTFRKGCHLKDHQETHKGDARKRNFVCNICNKKFFDKRVLTSHKRVHSGILNFKQIQQFRCEVCQKIFKRKSHLKEHTVVHLKHRPVVRTCSICKTEFLSVSSYKKHMRLRHENGEAILKGNYRVSKKLASVVADGAQVEIHVGGTKISETHAILNKIESDVGDEAQTNNITSNDIREPSVKSESNYESNVLLEETVELKLMDQVDTGLENDESKEVQEKASDPPETEGLTYTNSFVTEPVSMHDNVDSVNINDIGINTEVTGDDQTMLLQNVFNSVKKKQEKSKVCPLCGAKFGSSQAQVRHVKTIHGERTKFMCELCGIWLSNKAYLQTHQQRVHRESNIAIKHRKPNKRSLETYVHVLKLE